MLTTVKESLWKQFGASLDMLQNAMQFCPDNLWATETRFWYIAYHTLFYLDYYLTLPPNHFMPPQPFTLSEFDDSGAMPERVYTKEDLLLYLEHSRQKLHALLTGMTEELVASYWTNVSGTMSYPVVEILMYNMRHVQHHAAQLNLLLRQGIDAAPDWVSQTEDEL